MARKSLGWNFGYDRCASTWHDYEEIEVLGHPGYVALRELLLGSEETHLFLTYHLMYPPGTRIITLSRKSPLPLLYKEMAPLAISVGE